MKLDGANIIGRPASVKGDWAAVRAEAKRAPRQIDDLRYEMDEDVPPPPSDE